jgi:hypothetical protein
MVSSAKNVQPMEKINEYDGPYKLYIDADFSMTRFPELPLP